MNKTTNINNNNINKLYYFKIKNSSKYWKLTKKEAFQSKCIEISFRNENEISEKINETNAFELPLLSEDSCDLIINYMIYITKTTNISKSPIKPINITDPTLLFDEEEWKIFKPLYDKLSSVEISKIRDVFYPYIMDATTAKVITRFDKNCEVSTILIDKLCAIFACFIKGLPIEIITKIFHNDEKG